MKKFMLGEITSKPNEYEPMMMMLKNSAATGSSDDDCNNNNTPADSLAYNNLLLRRDGTVMTETHIRELRSRQGYCLTCPGDPVKLFAIKRSKMNPLYQKKEPIKSSNQSEDGVCFKCNPVKNPHRTIRRGSLGGGGGGKSETSMNMLPGTIHSMQLNSPADPTKRPPKRKSSFGPLSNMNAGGSSGGSGSDHSLTSSNHKESSARDLNEQERKAGIMLRSRSKSPGATGPLTNRSPKRSGRVLSPMRGISDHTMIVAAAAAAAARRTNVPLRRAASNDLDTPLTADDDQPKGAKANGKILKRSISSGGVGGALPMKEESKLDNSDASEVWDDFADFASKLKDRDGGGIGSDRGKKKANSVDSDGFFDQSVDGMDAGFHSSFLDLGIGGVETTKPANLLSSKDDEEVHESEKDELFFGTTDQQQMEAVRCASPIVVIEAQLRGGEQQITQQQLSEPSPGDEVDDNWDERIDLLQGTLSSLVQITEDRFGSLEKQISTVLQQQTLILQQHAAILKLVTSTPTNPVPAIPPPTSPTTTGPKPSPTTASPTTTSQTITTTDDAIVDVPSSIVADLEDKCETPRNDFIATVPKFELVSPLADTPGKKDRAKLSLNKSTMPSSRHLGEAMRKDSSLRSSSSSASSAKSAQDSTGQDQKSDGDINSLLSSEGSNSALMHPDANDRQDPPNCQNSSGEADFEQPLTDMSETPSTENGSATELVSVVANFADSRLDSTPQESPISSEGPNPLSQPIREPTQVALANEAQPLSTNVAGDLSRESNQFNNTPQESPVSHEGANQPSQPVRETTQVALGNGAPPLSINVAGDFSGESNQFDRDLQRSDIEISNGDLSDLRKADKEISNGSYGDENLMNTEAHGGEKRVSRRNSSRRPPGGSERRSSKRSASEKAKKKEKKREKKKKSSRRSSDNLDEPSAGSVNTEESSA